MRTIAALIFLTITGCAQAEVHTKIIDTGAGLATVPRFPNGDIMVYDTGHWNHDDAVFQAFRDFIGNNDIDLLVASHSDSDHLAATDELFNEYRVHRVIRTGYEREDTATWRAHRTAIRTAANVGLTHDINLAYVTLPHGTTYEFGGAVVTYLSGFHEPLAAWGLTGSEFRNGNSIVIRVEYGGKSILFTGDAVGRHEDSPQTAPAIASERYLIDHAGTRPIDSDVMLVPHHGSDDASSTEFIRAVSPRWVIFSAGHQYGHPKRVTAERYTALGYAPRCLLRTDIGDDEGGDERRHGRQQNHDDPVGDDSIEIILPENGDIIVRYEGGAPVACDEVTMPGGNAPVVAPDPVVKKSSSGICHGPDSPWYDRTQNFEAFPDVASCLASGGRLPR